MQYKNKINIDWRYQDRARSYVLTGESLKAD